MKWTAYKTKDDKIALSTNGFNRAVNERLKEIPGYRYNPRRAAWTWPLLWDICLALRKAADDMGADIKILPSLREWAQAEKTHAATIPDVQSKELQHLPRLAEVFPHTAAAIATRPFQTVGAKFIATNRAALLADEPGLGKTLQTIAAVVEADLQGPILVIGPKAAVGITWPAEVRQWAPGEYVQVIGTHLTAAQRSDIVRRAGHYSTGAKFDVIAASEGRPCWSRSRVWICVGPNYIRKRFILDKNKNYIGRGAKRKFEYVRETVPELFDIEWAAVIVDESHKTLAGQNSQEKRQSAQRVGLGSLKLQKNGIRVALSGTPFRGKKENLWGTLNWLRPQLYRGFWSWAERHFGVMTDHFGNYETGEEPIDEAAFYAEASSVMIRRTKAEVAKDLPPKMYAGNHLDPDDKNSPIAVWLPMTAQQTKTHRALVRNAVAQIKGGTLMANGTFAEMTRFKQIACSQIALEGETVVPVMPSNKFEYLLQILADRGIGSDPDGDRKVLVGSQFTKLLERFHYELAKHKIDSVLFTGKTTEAKRRAAKKQWQKPGGPRVMLLAIEAGGTSLTLDAYTDDVVTLDEPWNRDDEDQFVNRIHRLSNLHQVTVHRLRSLGGIEEGLARKTSKADRDIKSLIDGTRGVAFAEQLIGWMEKNT